MSSHLQLIITNNLKDWRQFHMKLAPYDFFQTDKIYCSLLILKWLDMLCWAQILTPFSLTCQVGLMVEHTWGILKFFNNYFCQLSFGKKSIKKNSIARMGYGVIFNFLSNFLNIFSIG